MPDPTGGPLTGDDDQDPTEGTPPSPGSLALTPELVRGTPEYKALQRERRSDARKIGNLEAQLSAARTEAENARTAAEASTVTTQREQIRTILGDDGVTAWENIADLSSSNPVEAARQMRELGLRLAQTQAAGSPPPAGTPITPPAPPAGGTNVPPPPSTQGSLGGNAPLGQPSPDSGWDGIIAGAQADFEEIVKRNQDPLTRNRVTMKDRAKGMMAYITGAYAQHFKEDGTRPRHG